MSKTNLAKATPGKAARRLPDGAKEILQDFVVAVLRSKVDSEHFTRFSADWFRKLADEEDKKKLSEATCMPDEPSKTHIATNPPAATEHGPEETTSSSTNDNRGSASRRQGVSAESYDPSVPPEKTEVIKSFPKTEDQLHRVKEAVREVLIFRSLDEDQLNKVIDALEEVDAEEHEDVIKFGDETADYFYVIETGEFDCFVPGPNGGEMVKIHEYINKGSFGELALMYNQPRAATVRARNAGRLWRLDRDTFKRIVVRGAYEKRQLYMSLLEKVDFIAGLQAYEKQNICDALVGKTYGAGEVVIQQGDNGDGMYFVEAGEVICLREEGQKQIEVGRAVTGEYVGELALIANQPRAATVTATVEGTKLAFLDSKAFERLMGPCVEILKKNADRYKARMEQAHMAGLLGPEAETESDG